MTSTKGYSHDVRIYMQDKFSITKRKFINMNAEQLRDLYQRFSFTYKDNIPYEKWITVLSEAYK
jgi:hypothetical protein